jgi:hypothetical protein
MAVHRITCRIGDGRARPRLGAERPMKRTARNPGMWAASVHRRRSRPRVATARQVRPLGKGTRSPCFQNAGEHPRDIVVRARVRTHPVPFDPLLRGSGRNGAGAGVTNGCHVRCGNGVVGGNLCAFFFSLFVGGNVGLYCSEWFMREIKPYACRKYDGISRRIVDAPSAISKPKNYL